MATSAHFVVVIVNPKMNEPMFLKDSVGIPMRFETRVEARLAARGAFWETAWEWWIVELRDDGDVVFGPEV